MSLVLTKGFIVTYGPYTGLIAQDLVLGLDPQL